MNRRLAFLTAQSLGLLVLLSITCGAQSQDRSRIEKELDALREQLKQKEEEFLAPSAEDRAQYAQFLLEPDTGLARLLPREKYQDKLILHDGGAYYSFTRQTNGYYHDPQIALERDTLRTGFVGADFGFLASLGDVPIETAGLDHKGAQTLTSFVAPSLESDARDQQRRAGIGFTAAGYVYKSSLPTMTGRTYIVRSISYGRFDLLVAFRIVRQDTDGSVILVWKKLKEFPTPILERH